MYTFNLVPSGDESRRDRVLTKNFAAITIIDTMANETGDTITNASNTTFASPFHGSNGTSSEVIGDQASWPDDLKFGPEHKLTIVTYSLLICISLAGNTTVLVAMCKRRRKTHSRINTMFMHLAIADLIVTLLLMPIDMYWAYTVQWLLSDSMCRAAAFLRIFGLYLSGFIIICISVDRYLAVLKPMNLYQVDRRGKFMLTLAWLASAICSVPQIFIFHLQKHPTYTTFQQCMVYKSFSSKFLELFYLYAGMVLMYLLPLAVIVFCYTSIVLEIFRRSRESNLDYIRRSGLGFLGRARKRTLKMTIVTVVVFLICWTPYYVMCVWFWMAPESTETIHQLVKRGLFLFASTNSCMNPIVYGIFNIRTHRLTLAETQSRARTCSGRISYATDTRLPALTLSLRSVE